MPKSTEVVPVEEPETTDLVEVEIDAEEAALIAANQGEVDQAEFQIPIIKLAQPLTNEVTDGICSPGQFVIPLTGEAFDGPLEFVVAGKGKGRFRPGNRKTGTRTLVAYDTNTVPDYWTDDPFVGQPFSEHPDAEEQFKRRVDAKEQEWGSGPPIQTTFNYTGYIVGSEVPVRLSLRRTSAPAARKWNTLLEAVLRGQFWAKTFVLDSTQQRNDNGTYYTVTVAQGRPTTAAEKKEAIKLAKALRNQQVTTVGDDEDAGPRVEPDAAGGLDV